MLGVKKTKVMFSWTSRLHSSFQSFSFSPRINDKNERNLFFTFTVFSVSRELKTAHAKQPLQFSWGLRWKDMIKVDASNFRILLDDLSKAVGQTFLSTAEFVCVCVCPLSNRVFVSILQTRIAWSALFNQTSTRHWQQWCTITVPSWNQGNKLILK